MENNQAGLPGQNIVQADVVVIGAGAVGSSVARELSKYQLDVVLVEKDEDIGGNASKTNSAMMICGYDTPPDTLESKLAKGSNAMMDTLSRELDVAFDRIGALQVAQTPEEIPAMMESYRQAMDNGIYDAAIIGKEKLLEMEPNLSDKIEAGLWIPREGHVDVFELLIAYAENAAENGVKIWTSAEVTDIICEDNAVKTVVTKRGSIRTRYVVNAAGVFGDTIGKMVGIADFYNYPRYGQFYILDKNLPYMPDHMIMPVPTPLTRGKLVIPTIHGNLLLGPTAVNGMDRYDKATTKESLDVIIAETRKLLPAINPRDAVTQFTGIRPARTPKGYHIRAFESLKGYIEATGILTGVSTSPAMGVHIVSMLADEGLELIHKKNFNPYRMSIKRFKNLSAKEQDELIAKDPRYGHVICRCETVTEAEIVEAIHRNPGAWSVDAVKRRLRAGMGRCQGGFCSPRVVEILARELGVPAEIIRKNEPGSELLTEKNRV